MNFPTSYDYVRAHQQELRTAAARARQAKRVPAVDQPPRTDWKRFVPRRAGFGRTSVRTTT